MPKILTSVFLSKFQQNKGGTFVLDHCVVVGNRLKNTKHIEKIYKQVGKLQTFVEFYRKLPILRKAVHFMVHV